MKKIEIAEVEQIGGVLRVIAEVNEYEHGEHVRQHSRTPLSFGHSVEDAARLADLGQHAYSIAPEDTEAVKGAVRDLLAPYVAAPPKQAKRKTAEHLLGEV